MPRRVIILGSTGSIGTQSLDVVRQLNALHARGEHPDSYHVVGLAAGSNLQALAQQASQFPSARIASAAGDLPPAQRPACATQMFTGPDAAERLVREVECDLVIAAIVGSAGLGATLAAVELGRDVALANKEALVAAGALVVPAAIRSGARLLPIDSEHSAVWQCVGAQGWTAHRPPGAPGPAAPPMSCADQIVRVILTASGGPFRTWTKDRIDHATPEEALKHPTWSMGAKVTIDSASLMNKALEIIEAHWLFGLGGDRIQAVIHPQSIVHAMVEFADGGVIAQLAPADMRIPIQYALAWPGRSRGAWPRLDWSATGRLEFEPPDLERFPALGLAYDVIDAGPSAGTAGAILNAANEEAVLAFLARRIPFGRIGQLAASALSAVPASPLRALGDVLEAQNLARSFVRGQL